LQRVGALVMAALRDRRRVSEGGRQTRDAQTRANTKTQTKADTKTKTNTQ